MAKAALVNILVDMEFNPDTSTIDGIIIISLVPTYCWTFPDATVDTITFGTPIGKALIPGVTKDVPPVPPREIIPSNFPSAYSLGINFSIPFDKISVPNALSFWQQFYGYPLQLPLLLPGWIH